jgi:CHAT domain-containing protein
MTALAMLRQRIHLNGPPSEPLLVFADPVFERDDPRIEIPAPHMLLKAATGYAGRTAIATESPFRSNMPLPRLPATRGEAEVIADTVSGGRAEVALGFDANLRRATDERIGSYSILHFATHSVFNDERPESSGVVLSLFDRQGNPVDGYLRLRDIYNLKLSADLVVLSACDTALGKDIKGEGIAGLTRGFLYAGAPRVVATLWSVDDEATSEFMRWFYQGVLQKHESPSAALREAQAEIRKQRRWQSPYYWGAFIIEGEWLPYNRSEAAISH